MTFLGVIHLQKQRGIGQVAAGCQPGSSGSSSGMPPSANTFEGGLLCNWCFKFSLKFQFDLAELCDMALLEELAGC